jgi:predicted regulator of amino acid metabolism with ACT domain
MRLAPSRFVPRTAVSIICASVALVVVAHAADLVKPNIKPGLWEVTNSPQVTGDMPISEDQLAKMSPEQRARVEAMMKQGMASANKTRVYKDCMTPEKIARGFDIAKEEGKSCKRKIVSSTANELQLHDECDGENRKTVSDVHFQVKGSTAMTGQINVIITSGAKTMKVDSKVQGKWLAADCGSVKDTELEK